MTLAGSPAEVPVAEARAVQAPDAEARPASAGGYDVIVIGAGQAGLAVGYYLAKRGLRFAILDERPRVGDIWRSRWDSLRLFTPARFASLPSMHFPAGSWSFPTRDQMANYLETYATRWHLPVRTRVRADAIRPAEDGSTGFLVTAGHEEFKTKQVVVATGGFTTPRMPDFAGELDPAIRQLHSTEYRNPAQFREGGVLIVGAGNSGAEIALDAAREHPTWLSGRDPGSAPIRPESPVARVFVPVLWFVVNRVLTVDTPLGRRVRPFVRAHGGPVVRVKHADLAAAGVQRVSARTVGARDGQPILDDGQVLDVTNVVWCTGFRHEFGFLPASVIGADGWPMEDHGVVTVAPGLYFVGLPFQRSFASMLIGGVGRDAAFIARKIAERAGGSAPRSRATAA
jgi:putative flavoprotein involved in K+ transport